MQLRGWGWDGLRHLEPKVVRHHAVKLRGKRVELTLIRLGFLQLCGKFLQHCLPFGDLSLPEQSRVALGARVSVDLRVCQAGRLSYREG